MRDKSKIFIFSLILTQIFMLTAVQAQNGRGQSNSDTIFGEKLKEMGENADQVLPEQKVQQKVENKCEAITNRIRVRIEAYDNNKDKHIGIYTRVRERVANIIARVEEKTNADTTEAKENLETLDQKISALEMEYNKMIELLKDTQNYACGESQGYFAAALKDARVQLAVVRENFLGVHKYIQESLKPSIQELRKRVQTEKQSQSQTGNFEEMEE